MVERWVCRTSKGAENGSPTILGGILDIFSISGVFNNHLGRTFRIYDVLIELIIVHKHIINIGTTTRPGEGRYPLSDQD